jgi:hypothetical protein
MQEEDIGTTPQLIPPNPTVRPPALDLDDFATNASQHAVIAPESSISFAGDRETTFEPESPRGAVVTANRDPIPLGPVGWVMKITRLKRVKHARIVGGLFIGIIVALAVFIVAREYFISFVTTPIPKTIPLVKDIPVIE